MTRVPLLASCWHTSTSESVEELAFVDAHHVGAGRQQQDFGGHGHGRGANAGGIVAHHVFGVVAGVEGGLEDFDPLPGNAGTGEAANQLFGFARKHGAAHHFNPAPARGVVAVANAGFNKHRQEMSR